MEPYLLIRKSTYIYTQSIMECHRDTYSIIIIGIYIHTDCVLLFQIELEHRGRTPTVKTPAQMEESTV